MYLWLRRSLHSSWMIAGVSLGVIVSVVSMPSLALGVFGSLGWLLTGVALSLFAVSCGRNWCFALAIIGGLLIGGWRGAVVQSELTPYQSLVGHELTVEGIVSEDVDIGRGGELILRLKDISIEGHDLSGQVWASTRAGPDIKRGDIVTVKSKINEGFGGFAASLYRAELVELERPVPGDVARQVRDGFAEQVRKGVPDPESSLGIGYLVGQRRALPAELDESLRIAGLTHVVVASGYNLTILVRLARRLFVRVSKYLAAFSASSMIVAFIAVTGMSPSMSRAGLVAGLSLLAWYYGRKFHPLVLLSLAAATTLIINPTYGWGDIGWQLSFAAFAGVMILAPLLQAYFFGDDKPGVVRQILIETISAQIVTLPIIAATFGVMSNVAIIANMLVLPLVPLAMLLTFVAGVGAMILPSFAEVIALPATWLLSYMTHTASWLANLSWAEVSIDMTVWLVVAMYVVVISACIYMRWRTGFALRKHNIIE